ncbi:leucine rich repeat containing 51 [Latimeria chalumnae]|uniref:Leucine-rich repeat-containing protein 51 n=1 Tax=Latimeria chalumnae TaxID=7897 RepID=M3XIQ7_LATCH|nr:PREDICTED: leucine-rich repeat-containing protein 51-like [Latimeria chalumnae]|eukprot:XP_006003641.1 PREDICTED: leucine-rich repeat-containing protein 51-like [Latimeria chalumnae]
MPGIKNEELSLYGPPVDFSFKCINNVDDVLLEEPRKTLRQLKSSQEDKFYSRSIKLNNNTLTDLTNFNEVLSKMITDISMLSWIDLSFNDLSAIEPVLTLYKNLKVLYLHGNSISSLSEVDKLACLPYLKTLTLHGNPIETEKGYRNYVVVTLPQVKKFDFSGVTKQDRATAKILQAMYIKPKRAKKHTNK